MWSGGAPFLSCKKPITWNATQVVNPDLRKKAQPLYPFSSQQFSVAHHSTSVWPYVQSTFTLSLAYIVELWTGNKLVLMKTSFCHVQPQYSKTDSRCNSITWHWIRPKWSSFITLYLLLLQGWNLLPLLPLCGVLRKKSNIESNKEMLQSVFHPSSQSFKIK